MAARAYWRLFLRDKSELTRDVPQQQPRARCGKAPGQGSTRRQSVTGPGSVWSAEVTQKAWPSSALNWAPDRPSPEERPVRRRTIHGSRYCRVNRAWATWRAVQPGGEVRGIGVRHSGSSAS